MHSDHRDQREISNYIQARTLSKYRRLKYRLR